LAGYNDEASSATNRVLNNVAYPILRNHFQRDEFLGRINQILFFLPFDDDELRQIVEKELQYWKATAKSKHNISLGWTKEVVDVLMTGYNIRYGARSIKHEVEKRVVNQIAKAHELDSVEEGGSIWLSVEGQAIALKCEKQKKENKGFFG
jgi:ATP-dependent Clp protease ATP-binding subunit ClpB